MEQNIAKVMAALDIEEAAAQTVIALFIEEGFTSIDEAIAWASETLEAPAQPIREDIRFDQQDLYVDEEGNNPGYHPIWFEKGELAGFVA